MKTVKKSNFQQKIIKNFHFRNNGSYQNKSKILKKRCIQCKENTVISNIERGGPILPPPPPWQIGLKYETKTTSVHKSDITDSSSR